MRTADPRPGEPPRPLLDGTLRWFARRAISVYYRRIEVTGLDNMPRSGPVIVVANHANSLIDGAIIGSLLPRMPRFLTASIVWDFKLIGPVLNAAGVVPVFRRQDGRQASGQLSETFGKAEELLAAGGVLAIFPEGLSHNDSRLLPLKTGVARIALEALEADPDLDLRIVPVCLHYAAKARFRSSVMMQVGTPIRADHELRGFTSGDSATRSQALRQLKARIREALLQVSLQSSTWEDVRLVGCAAEIWRSAQGPQDAARGAPRLPDIVDTHRLVLTGARWFKSNRPDEWAAMKQGILGYADGLDALGVGDRHIDGLGRRDGQSPLAGTPPWVWPALPLALIGLVLNAAPGLVLWFLRRGKDPDKQATWSVFSGVLVFPLYWLAAAVIASGVATVAWGPGPGIATGFLAAVVIPASGLIAARTWEVYRRLRQDLRAARRLAADPDAAQRLAQVRAGLLQGLRGLSDIFAARGTGKA